MVFGGLFNAMHSFSERKTLPLHQPLCASISQVLSDWATQFGQDKAMKSLFNGNNIYREMDEYVVPLFNLINYLQSLEISDPKTPLQTQHISLLDIASGKGYLSLLISSLAVHVPILRCITSITMIDKNIKMNLQHLEHVRQTENQKYVPIPIAFLPMNLHSTDMEQLLHNSNRHHHSNLETMVVVMAIHPCKRLSSRCIDIFNQQPRIAAMFLAPCCVPNPTKQPIQCGQSRVIPIDLHASASPYDAWVNFLESGIDCACDRREIVRIRERSLFVDGVQGEVWTKHIGNLCVVAVRDVAVESSGSTSSGSTSSSTSSSISKEEGEKVAGKDLLTLTLQELCEYARMKRHRQAFVDWLKKQGAAMSLQDVEHGHVLHDPRKYDHAALLLFWQWQQEV